MAAEQTPLDQTRAKAKSALLAAFFFSLPINLLMLTVPLYMMQLFDRVLGSQSQETLIFLTMIAVGGVGFMALLEAVRGRILMRFGGWMEQRLALPSFARGVEASLVGKPYRMEALRDIGSVKSVFSGSAITALFDLPWAPIYLLVIYLLHPMLGHMALGGSVVLILLALLNEFLTQKKFQQAGFDLMIAQTRAESMSRNASVIDAMGLMRALGGSWDQQADKGRMQYQQAAELGGVLQAISKFIRMCLQLGMLALGAYLALQAEITGGAMLAASIIVGRALAPIDQIIGGWKQIASALGAWRRLKQLYAQKSLRAESMELPAPKGHLTLEGVAIRLPGMEKPVLSGLSFDVKPGESLGILGQSGSGKSSLAQILVGSLPPIAGAVRLDGADLFAWDHDRLGPYIGYLPQEVELFAGSIAQNIARMQEPNPQQVVQAAKLAGIHDLVLSFADGYDTVIGDGGIGLSGGQRQRVGLARALYAMPKLVILDEPNANLDEAGEIALKRSVAALKQAGSSVIIIGHRRGGMDQVDKLVLVKDGAMALYGSRQAVLDRLMGKPSAPPQKTAPQPVPQAMPQQMVAPKAGVPEPQAPKTPPKPIEAVPPTQAEIKAVEPSLEEQEKREARQPIKLKAKAVPPKPAPAEAVDKPAKVSKPEQKAALKAVATQKPKRQPPVSADGRNLRDDTITALPDTKGERRKSLADLARLHLRNQQRDAEKKARLEAEKAAAKAEENNE